MAFGETFAGPSSYGDPLSREDLKSAIIRKFGSLDGLMTMHAEVVLEGVKIVLSAEHDHPSINMPGNAKLLRMIQDPTP